MSSSYLSLVRSLDELYALMDRDRVAAAKVAESVFQNDVNTAITSIAEISSVASARVLADTQVASAKMLIDAEVAATRLAAGAEQALAEYKSHVMKNPTETPADVVDSMIQEIGRTHSTYLSSSARQSIEAIERDAEAAIAKLKSIGGAAIDDIRSLAGTIAANTEENAARAAEKLATYRQHNHTIEEAAEDGDQASRMLVTAAHDARETLRQATDSALRNIHAVTNEASSAIQASSSAATQRISAACDKALGRIQETVQLHLRHSDDPPESA